MFNLKWCIISGGTALALSFVLSLLVGQTSVLIALLRAGIFAAVFFGIAAGIRALIVVFIPELLPVAKQENAIRDVFSGDPSAESTGSQVDITLDDESPRNAALPEIDPTETPETAQVGDFSDLVSGLARTSAKDIDEKSDKGYNDGAEEFAPSFDNVKLGDAGDFSLDFGAFVTDDVGGAEAAGSDSVMDSFALFPGSSAPESSGTAPASGQGKYGKKPKKLEGDFDPKEIAAGIRTVLRKEKG